MLESLVLLLLVLALLLRQAKPTADKLGSPVLNNTPQQLCAEALVAGASGRHQCLEHNCCDCASALLCVCCSLLPTTFANGSSDLHQISPIGYYRWQVWAGALALPEKVDRVTPAACAASSDADSSRTGAAGDPCCSRS